MPTVIFLNFVSSCGCSRLRWHRAGSLCTCSASCCNEECCHNTHFSFSAAFCFQVDALRVLPHFIPGFAASCSFSAVTAASCRDAHPLTVIALSAVDAILRKHFPLRSTDLVTGALPSISHCACTHRIVGLTNWPNSDLHSFIDVSVYVFCL